MAGYIAVCQMAAKCLQAGASDLFRGSQNGFLGGADLSLDKRCLAAGKDLKFQQTSLFQEFFGRLYHGFRQGKGNDFQRCQHLARLQELIMLDAGQRQPLIERIEGGQQLTVKAGQPQSRHGEIHPPGRCLTDFDRCPSYQPGQPRRCHIFGHIMRSEAGDCYLAEPGSLQARNIPAVQHPPLAQAAIRQRQGMGQNCPLRCLQTDRPEFHQPALLR